MEDMDNINPRKKSYVNYEKAFLEQQQKKAQEYRKYKENRKKYSFFKRLKLVIFRFLKSCKMFFINIFETIQSIGHSLQDTYMRRKIIKKTQQKNNHTSRKKKVSWLLKIIIACALLGFIFLGFVIAWFLTLEIPSIENFENRKISNSTKIYDRTGDIVLYDIHENIRRTVVDFDNIAQSAKDAIIAIEDHTFYQHSGVVWKSTIRAYTQTVLSRIGLSNRGTAGGSTLTQQVVKNTLLNKEQVISRKVKEWILAYKIEGRLSKDEILEIYLNEAPYGGTVYGIQEASRRFFGVPASDLSPAQSAYLAAIPQIPTYYSPYGPNKDKLDQRQRTVLREMNRYGFLNDSEYKEALEEVVEFLPQEEHFAKSLHFVQYVREELERMYGVDMVQNGGLQVRTTLDYTLQQKAEEFIKNHIDEVQDVYDASNAALVAIEAETGHILTMVGSRDYHDTEGFDGNYNVALAPRQPGSAFKPIAYAALFERGYYPESSIFDTQTQFNARCQPHDTTSNNGCYSPNNHDRLFNGPMNLRSALAESRNIPAVKVNYLAGMSRVIQKARDMGISSLTRSPEFYGLGLVLGGGEVSLLEMTSAYTVFANEGMYVKPTGILEVTDIRGNIIDSFVELPQGERALEENAAHMINSILSDNVARTPLFGSQSFLYFGERSVAGKTGTTNDNVDAWLVGYTPDVAVGVWTGNNLNEPMKRGSSISGKPWRQFMDEIIKSEYTTNRSFRNYELPENFNELPNMIRGDWFGGTTVYLDLVSGKRATEFTPEENKIAVPQPDPHTILHWINKDNPTVLDLSQDDAQYKNWEYGVQKYVQENMSEIFDMVIPIPDEYDDVHTGEGLPEPAFDIMLSGVIPNMEYDISEELFVTVEGIDIVDRDIRNVEFFVNNAFVSADNLPPFGTHIRMYDLLYKQKDSILKVVVTNTNNQKVVKELPFSLILGAE